MSERIESFLAVDKLGNRSRLKEVMQTESWETKELLLGATSVEFVQVERDLQEPEEAKQIRFEDWEKRIEAKKQELEQAFAGNKYTVKTDQESGLSTLYEVQKDELEKVKMWVGETITLAQSGVEWLGGDVKINVYPINYTEWIACSNQEYTEVFRRNNLPLPYSGIGASVIIETLDGFYPLTRRGIETPVYPGRLYSVGGGPKAGQKSTEALFEEIVEETGLVEGEHFDPLKLKMLALVTDAHFDNSQHARPELVSYLPVNVTFGEMEKILYDKAINKGQKEADVWGLEAFSAYDETFGQRLIYHGPEFCPPTEAALAHTFLYKEAMTVGVDDSVKRVESLMARLNTFKRQNFVPPVSRLS